MKILLTGVDGQLGHELRSALAPLGTLVGINRQACDLADADAVRAAVRGAQPDVVVNAAAYTAVDGAEKQPESAFRINGIAPGILGEEARRLGALVVHYSTDYVFDGALDRPYTETDAVAPLNVYGRSKLAGEEALQASGARHLILRTSWVVGVHGGNFARTILRLAAEREALNVVADQRGVPTTAPLIAATTALLLRRHGAMSQSFPCGLYHLAAGGVSNWHEYACHVVRAAIVAGKPLRLRPEAIRPIASGDYPLPARRPLNSCLDTTKLRRTFGIELPEWKTALAPVLHQILETT